MDFLTNGKISIMQCDAHAEDNVKMLAKAYWDSEDDINFTIESVDRSLSIGRVKQNSTVGKFFVVLMGYPAGILLGGLLGWWTISVWWDKIFP